MAFDKLSTDALTHGSLGAKSANVTEVPEVITKLIQAAWKHQQSHANQYHQVKLSDKGERDEFHTYAKAAAKAHEPELDYRKLPRPGADESVAFFTLRKVTPDMVRPGRKPGNNGNAENTEKEETPSE